MKTSLWRAALLFAVLAGSNIAFANTYAVDRTDDVTTGACTAAANDCSLRGAIITANANPGADTINLQDSVTYKLTLGPADSAPGAFIEGSGDLDITGPLTLSGNKATVDGNQVDRVFDIGNAAGTSFSVTINLLTITHGHSVGFLSFGGGINVRAAALTLNACRILDNDTQEGEEYDNGGGIAVNSLLFPATSASLAMTDCTVSGNDGQHGGGIVLGGKTTATIARCTIDNNTGHGALGGGGLFVTGTDAVATIDNSTVAVNTASNKGGGVYLFNGSATVKQATIALNNASQGGGAIPKGGTIDDPNGGGILRSGNGLWANSAATHPDISGKITSQGFSLFQSNSGITGLLGNDLSNVVAQLDPLALVNNGGPTQTIALLAASPAVNSGDPAVSGAGQFDQRGSGFARVKGGHLDIGAFESGTLPTLSINDVSVNETNGGSAQAVFTITLSTPSNQIVSVVAQSASNAGNPVATAGVDYTALPATTVTFNPGQISKTVNVTVLGDTLDENDEKFAVNLSGAVNATIGDSTGVCTIVDNDAAPLINASAPNTTEGNAGTTNMTFTLSLSAASGKTITVQYQTANAATLPATAGTDYTAVPLTTVTFQAGETTKTVNVGVKGDVLDEDNEHIALSLTNPVNATLGVITDGIIVDDDPTPTLSINDVQVTEGNNGTKLMNFTVTLSAVSGRTVTVNAATGSGGSPAATDGSDYVGLPSTLITFTPGQTTKQVSITINGDIDVEQDEKFAVILSGAVNAALADSSGIGTILNDDAGPAQAPSD